MSEASIVVSTRIPLSLWQHYDKEAKQGKVKLSDVLRKKLADIQSDHYDDDSATDAERATRRLQRLEAFRRKVADGLVDLDDDEVSGLL